MINYIDSENIQLIYENSMSGRFSPRWKLKQAIGNVQRTDVFFAGVLNRMLSTFEQMERPEYTKTMCVDGKNLFYNPEFVKNIPMEELETILVHEILHIVLGHHIAFSNELKLNNENIRYLVNVATDLAINHMLRGRPLPANVLFPGKGEFVDMPEGKDARWYYYKLIEKYQNKPKDQPEEGDKGDDSKEDDEGEEGSEGSDGSESTEGDDSEGAEGTEGEESEGGEGEGEGTGEGEGEGEGEGKGSGKGKGSGGSGSGGGGEGEEEEGERTGEGEDKGTGKLEPAIPDVTIPEHVKQATESTGRIEADPDATPENASSEMAKHSSELQKDLADAEQIEQKREQQGFGAGSGAGGGKGYGINYKDIVKPKSNIPWNQILSNFTSLPQKTDKSYMVPNPRFAEYMKNTGIFMAGYKEDKVKELDILVDVSGSMPKSACEKIFNEIAQISKSKSFGMRSMIRLVTFDTIIQSENVFSNIKSPVKSIATGKPVPKENMHSLPLNENVFKNFKWSVSGGGTSINSCLEGIKKLKPTPELVIVLTDGYFMGNEISYLNSNPKLPFQIVWLMTTDQHYNIGKTYKLEDYNYGIT